jgi:PAS domain S-box-containing protein
MLAILFFVQASINTQNLDSDLISIVEKKRDLNRRITKSALILGYVENEDKKKSAFDTLKILVKEWGTLHDSSQTINNKVGRGEIDSLLNINNVYAKQIGSFGNSLVNNTDLNFSTETVNQILSLERPYLKSIDLLLQEYQKIELEHQNKLKAIIYILVFGTFFILLSGFLTVLRPALIAFVKKNKETADAAKALVMSKEKIKLNLAELEMLKADLEIKETYNKIFIEEAPTAIAMLDANMCYIAASKKWLSDYKMEDKEVIGKSHYDLFPEIGDDWKANHQKCLNGAINVCDGAPFLRQDGTVQWIFWDVRPWYISEGKVGGLIMHTGDITEIKENEEEKDLIKNILNNTSEVARIGTWEVDLVKNRLYWSKVVCEIHGLSEGYLPDIETGINFYKEGKSREAIKKAVHEAIEHGTPYDLELEIVTQKGEFVWVRSIGKVEMVGGKIIKLFGLLQDINDTKLYQLALNEALAELKAVLNSGPISIISTDNNLVVKHFNRGAELLLGYTAEETIGLIDVYAFHLKEEMLDFKEEIAKKYDKDLYDFDPFKELAINGDYNTREWTYIKKDGSVFPVELTITAIKNEQGEQIGYLGVATDISEKKQAKEELLRKNQLLNFAEEITLMGNWQWNLFTGEVKWSDNLYGVFGLDIKETNITYDTYFNFVHPEDKDFVASHVEKAILEKEFPSNFVHRIMDSDGNVKIIRLLGEAVTNVQGDVTEIIGACQDVTVQKTSEMELLRKNHQLSFAERIAMMGNWQWDVPTDTLKWSSGLYKIYEYDESITDLNYDTFFSQVHPDDQKYITQLVQNSFKEKKFPNNFIHRIITSSGKIKTVHYLGEVILNEQGEVVEMMGACQDITEQKMEENKFRGLLESAPDAMVITNENSKIQIINKQAEKLFGYKIEEIYDKPVDLLLPMRFLQDHELKRKTFLNKPETTKLSDGKDLFAITKDGREFPIQMSLSPLKTEDGMLISAAIRDVTEQKIARNKILAAKNDLEILAQKLIKNNNQLADFAHITSHNLRAPVSNLNSLLGLYNAAENEQDRSFLFKKFEKVIDHLTGTLNNLVDAIKIKNTKIKDLEEVSLINVLNKTKEILTGQILNNDVIITSDFSSISKIKYDRIYLESIFLNLVGNSIKYKSNKRIPEIFIKSETVEGKVIIKFRDNGLGIDLKKYGDKLFGFNKVFHRHPEAKGVGLFMVKTQIEALNGTIHAESEVDKGTTFIIKF